jgi:hypothetical protein
LNRLKRGELVPGDVVQGDLVQGEPAKFAKNTVGELSPARGIRAAGPFPAKKIAPSLSVQSDYSREGLCMSLPRPNPAFIQLRSAILRGAILRGTVLSLVFAGSAIAASAQYPGLVKKPDSKIPIMRSIAVLEWTGEPGKPSASRLLPVSVFDGEQLNDGTIYLTQPQPIALAGDVEYELQTAGKPIGIFDVFGASDVEGIWQGVGIWKPLSVREAEKASSAFNTSNLYGGVNGKDSEDDDKPVLKRKHPKDSVSDDKPTSAGDASKAPDTKSTSSAQDSDPDRPTMKRKSASDSGSSGTSNSDPDQPTLHRKSGDDSSTPTSSGSTAGTDPDRPTLHRSRHTEDTEDAGPSTAAPDPDRPRLKHGKSDEGVKGTPRLDGFPPSMQQAVAVSDAANHPDHPWQYTWANPDDEAKMKGLLEDIARTELGLTTPPTAPAKPAKTARTATATKKVSMLPSKHPLPAELTNEHFRVFELAYGATATLVLTASTPKPALAEVAPDDSEPAPPVIKRGKPTATATKPTPKATSKPAAKPSPQKFVTLIAQPDLYGGILVLFKSVTDSAHLDERPRMTLVDAVDAMADNRGELLFDLRSKTQRRFALYRVLRGSAEQLFATLVPNNGY